MKHLRSTALAIFTVFFCSFAPSPRTGAPSSSSRKPNVLLIISDDLNSSLHTYAHPMVLSPNLDRLAGRGVRFDNAYCQYPVCNPSRTSFLTGLRPDSTGVIDNKTPFRSKIPNRLTLPGLFKQSGYYTARVGKVFHDTMEDPADWDQRVDNKVTPEGDEGEGELLNGTNKPWCRWLAANVTDEDQQDGQTAATALGWLSEKRDTPFFMAVGFRRPHDPWLAP